MVMRVAFPFTRFSEFVQIIQPKQATKPARIVSKNTVVP